MGRGDIWHCESLASTRSLFFISLGWRLTSWVQGGNIQLGLVWRQNREGLVQVICISLQA